MRMLLSNGDASLCPPRPDKPPTLTHAAAFLQFLKQLQELFDSHKTKGAVFITEKRC